MHHGRNFCSWRCNNKTNTDFFFFFHNFTGRRGVLVVGFSSLSIWFFFPLLLSQECSPFHLKSALQLLFGTSELPVSLLLHNGAIFSKKKVIWTQALGYLINLITELATISKWLMGKIRWTTDDSHPLRVAVDDRRKGCNFKHKNYF